MHACISLKCIIVTSTFIQEGIAPLHLASQKNYTDIIKLLIEHGADIDVPQLPVYNNMFLKTKLLLISIFTITIDKWKK